MKIGSRYTDFLKQPLELGMFVACDETGDILEEPKWDDYKKLPDYIFQHDMQKYEDAKERVLFEGFEFENKMKFTSCIQREDDSIYFTDRGKINFNGINIKTIEDLIKFNLELTETAIKQLRL